MSSNQCLNCGYTGGVWRIGLCNDCFNLKEDGIPMAVSQHSPYPEENDYFWGNKLPSAEDFQLPLNYKSCIIVTMKILGGKNDRRSQTTY